MALQWRGRVSSRHRAAPGTSPCGVCGSLKGPQRVSTDGAPGPQSWPAVASRSRSSQLSPWLPPLPLRLRPLLPTSQRALRAENQRPVCQDLTEGLGLSGCQETLVSPSPSGQAGTRGGGRLPGGDRLWLQHLLLLQDAVSPVSRPLCRDQREPTSHLACTPEAQGSIPSTQGSPRTAPGELQWGGCCGVSLYSRLTLTVAVLLLGA